MEKTLGGKRLKRECCEETEECEEMKGCEQTETIPLRSWTK